MEEKLNLEVEYLKLKSTVEAHTETIRELNKKIGLLTSILKTVIDKNGGLDFIN